MTISDLMRAELLSLEAYSQLNHKPDCRLHMNELPWSPLDCTPFALEQYPDFEAQNALEQCLSERYQISSANLLLTRGSDEAIDLLMRLFLRPLVDSILQCSPTFSMYAFYARVQGAGVVDCPLHEQEDFRFDLKRLENQWQPGTKLIMLCRPNNPTGSLLSLREIATLCQRYQQKAMIVVDEAYIEFSGAMSAITLLPQYDNLIVLRTLSKAYGLAGLRLGCVIASPMVVSTLKKLIAPFSLSSAVVDLGLQALKETAFFEWAMHEIKTLRQKLLTDLEQSHWIEKVYPSFANFILIKTSYSKPLFAHFERLGIAVRQFKNHLPQHLRITVGNEAQNQRLLEALASFSEELQ